MITDEITESVYRQRSGDFSSPWEATDTSVGIKTCIEMAATDVQRYLETYLVPTEVVNEFHRLLVERRYHMGEVIACQTRAYLAAKRLLWGSSLYPIEVEQVHQGSCSVSNAGNTDDATVVEPKESLIDVDECLTYCQCVTDERVAIEVTYWAGFESLPSDLINTVVKWAQKYVRELITWNEPIDADWPAGAPVISITRLSTRRRFKEPRETPFGSSHLGVEIQNALEPYRVIPRRSM
jgi:hypothetical protein